MLWGQRDDFSPFDASLPTLVVPLCLHVSVIDKVSRAFSELLFVFSVLFPLWCNEFHIQNKTFLEHLVYAKHCGRALMYVSRIFISLRGKERESINIGDSLFQLKFTEVFCSANVRREARKEMGGGESFLT